MYRDDYWYISLVDIFSLGISLFHIFFGESFYNKVFKNELKIESVVTQFKTFLEEKDPQEIINEQIKILLRSRGYTSECQISAMQSRIKRNKGAAYKQESTLGKIMLKNSLDDPNDQAFILLGMLQVILYSINFRF